jgi:hypothetical protein
VRGILIAVATLALVALSAAPAAAQWTYGSGGYYGGNMYNTPMPFYGTSFGYPPGSSPYVSGFSYMTPSAWLSYGSPFGAYGGSFGSYGLPYSGWPGSSTTFGGYPTPTSYGSGFGSGTGYGGTVMPAAPIGTYDALCTRGGVWVC